MGGTQLVIGSPHVVLDVALSGRLMMVTADPRDMTTSRGRVNGNRSRYTGQIDKTAQRAMVKLWVWQGCTVRNYPGAK
jgi:hypothetical protein